MKSEPLVSAIIIFLDAENYLEQAIESVFDQTYQIWELLLCDDGSTDGSTEIAQRYAKLFPDKVHYLEHDCHENRGMSATRNLGVRHAKGEYITWLDADDVWLSQNLQRQIEIIHEHPEAAMVYGPCQFWFSWTGLDGDRHRDFVQDIGVSPDTLQQPPQLLKLFLQDEMSIPVIGVLVRRTVLDEIGGFESSIGDEYEDVIVHSKISLRWPVFVSSECWYRYRIHKNSYTAKTTRAGGEYSERLIYLNRLADHMREKGLDNGEVWEIIQDQIREYSSKIKNLVPVSARQSIEKVKSGYWMITLLARQLAGLVLPQSFRSWLGVRLKGHEYRPPIGWVHFGGLRRVTPIQPLFSWGRGTPCDRFYIENFFKAHMSDIRGCVLEIGSRGYTLKFDGDLVKRHDVMYRQSGNPRATIVGDLCTGQGIAEKAFDCIILAQFFPPIVDFKAAIENAASALKPGGLLLVVIPGSALIGRSDMDHRGEIRRFTSVSAKNLFKKHFSPENLAIHGYGNVLTAVARLHGVAAEELSPSELDYYDPDYEMIIAVRAKKSEVKEGRKT